MAEAQVRHFNINFGRQHPAAHGFLRLLLELAGEVVTRVDPQLGLRHLRLALDRSSLGARLRLRLRLPRRLDCRRQRLHVTCLDGLNKVECGRKGVFIYSC